MNNISAFIEYYDELYECSTEQKSFYFELSKEYGMPTKFLRINCGTGYFEHYLAKEGHDVTGLEVSKEMLERANLRRRMPNTALRFFQMSSLEMVRFLGKGFYNVISCLDDFFSYIHDETLRRKFFYDCKELMAPRGTLVLEVLNYSKYKPSPMSKLPTRESVRAKLFTQLWKKENDEYIIKQDLETSSGKILSIIEGQEVYPVSIQEIESAARESGFTNFEKYADYSKNEFTPDSDKVLIIIS